MSARRTCRFWKVFSVVEREDGGIIGGGAGSWRHERRLLVDCGCAGPKMSENRRVGGAQWPRRRRGAFRGLFPFGDGAAHSGRQLALGSLSRAVPMASVDVLGGGGRMRANKISKNTYEIFLGYKKRFGACVVVGWKLMGQEIAAIESAQTLGASRRYLKLPACLWLA